MRGSAGGFGAIWDITHGVAEFSQCLPDRLLRAEVGHYKTQNRPRRLKIGQHRRLGGNSSKRLIGISAPDVGEQADLIDLIEANKEGVD
jgi:hypothetical protein